MIVADRFAWGIAAALAIVALAPAAAQTRAPATIAGFAAHDAASRQTIDYASIDTVLDAFVVREGKSSSVRYTVLKGDGQRAVARLMGEVATIDPARLNRDEQLAYWLNLRLLAVLDATATAFPATSTETLLAPDSAYLNTPVAKVAGVALSIGDIDRLLLKHWADRPDLIFGLVVPARGGPAFPLKAYRGRTVDAMLTQAGRDFVNRSGVVRTTENVATVSSFLVWHKAHLGGGDAALLARLNALAEPKLAKRLAAVTLIEERFDWKTNIFVERSFDSRGLGFNSGFGGGRGPSVGGGS